jgi:hypothetical protein
MRPPRSFNGSGNRISVHMPTLYRPAARGLREHAGRRGAHLPVVTTVYGDS